MSPTNDRLTMLGAVAVLVGAGLAPATAQSTCNDPAPEPSVSVTVPGNPFQALPSADGCWVFVSLSGPRVSRHGVGILRRDHGKLSLERVIRLGGGPTGMALTRHDSLLVVAAGDGIAFIDVHRAITNGKGALLGVLTDGVIGAGRVYANVTGDGRFAFVSDERTQSITVIDIDKAIAGGFEATAIVGKIPVGQSPIALTFSNDGRTLYTTSQAAPAAWRWPIECRPEAATSADVPPNHSQGAVIIVDVAKATTMPATSVISAVRAGCNPVRLVLSPSGNLAFVSARAMNALLVFDVQKMLADTAHALISSVPVGTAPVGIAVIDSGRKLVVTSSNRFGQPTDPQTLTVIALDGFGAGKNTVSGTIQAGAFPRELRPTADGRTLILTNFGSESIQIIDVLRLPIRP